MMSPADILSAQAAASLQRDILKYDLVGSPSRRDDIGTVYPAYNVRGITVLYNQYLRNTLSTVKQNFYACDKFMRILSKTGLLINFIYAF